MVNERMIGKRDGSSAMVGAQRRMWSECRNLVRAKSLRKLRKQNIDKKEWLTWQSCSHRERDCLRWSKAICG